MSSILASPFSSLQTALRTAVVALVTVAALSIAAPSAHAGAGEVKALQAALPVGVNIKDASTTQLFNAFIAVITAPNTKFATPAKQAVLMGEAMKAAGANATDAGVVFGMAVKAAEGNGADPLFDFFEQRRTAIAIVASTAGAGKGLNVAQIPDLAAETFRESGAPFIVVAAASKSKPGAGAIIGGRALQIFEDPMAFPDPNADAITLANDAMFDKKLAAAAQDVAQWIAAVATDTERFVVGVGDGRGGLNLKFADKIVLGTAAGDPTNAGNIVNSVLKQQILDPTGMYVNAPVAASNELRSAIVKKASTLAKTLTAVADIEEIQKIANSYGKLIATQNPDKPGKTFLTLSSAAGYVKTMATAVMSKPQTDKFGQPLTVPQIAALNDNKRDEIAEIAAYMVGGLIDSPELAALGTSLKGATKAAGIILKIITSAATIKPKTVKGADLGPRPETFAADVAASVAVTIEASSLDTNIKNALEALLTATKNGLPTTAAKINKAQAQNILNVLNEIYAGTADLNRFENGLDPVGAVSDPETDKHPFS